MKTRCLQIVALHLLAAASVAAARPLTTDRPDSTESPFTVEPGRVQLEVSAAQWTRDRHTPERDGVRTETWEVAPLNVRVGLTAASEVQFVHDGFVHNEVRAAGIGLKERVRGAGDLTIRYKHNLRGNDDGSSAWALMPYVKLPTAARRIGNDAWEGGVIVPFAADLGGEWGFGAMTEIAVVRKDDDSGHRLGWLNTATVSRGLSERLGVFFEVTWWVGEGAPAGTFNLGGTYALNDDLQFDLGANLGLTRAADDLVVFVGVSRRY